MKRLYFLFAGLLLLQSCQNDGYEVISPLDQNLYEAVNEASGGVGSNYFILPDSDDLNAIPQDPMNPLTREKVQLGKMLMHETAMARNPKDANMAGTYSCASCHHAAAGFAAGVRQGIGEGGSGFGLIGEGRLPDTIVHRDSLDIQPVKSPTILNVAYQDVMLWNGQFGGTGTNAGTEASWTPFPENFEGWQGVEVQAMVGQNVHRLKVDEDFVIEHGYRNMFDAAFGELPQSERYTRETAALAIAAFERTVMANRSPWQDYLKGYRDVMSDEQKRGAIVFLTSGKCVECHTGPALSSNTFYAFGLGDFDDAPNAVIQSMVDMDKTARGRGGFTNNPDDNYKFKTPTLYNLGHGNPLGHGGTIATVEDMIRYKVAGNKENTMVPDGQLAEEFGAISLSEQEILDLTAFVGIALQDPELLRYVPESLPSGACFPNSDVQSKNDMGCE